MKIDWYKHYRDKNLVYNKKYVEENLNLDKLYLELLDKYLKPKSKILECGCGPARTAISIAKKGFLVTAIDNDSKMLNFAKDNAKIANMDINFILLDYFKIKNHFKKDQFQCITHQGVLEHHNPKKIIKLLKIQLSISKFIIVSVPLNTPFNIKYFEDKIHRNLWTKKYWLKILKEFNIVETKTIKQRTDNLIIVIKRGDN